MFDVVFQVEGYSPLIEPRRLKRHLTSLLAERPQHSQSYEQTVV